MSRTGQDILQDLLDVSEEAQLSAVREHYLAYCEHFEGAQHTERTPACTRGCDHCCYHWVEDVYSFEVLLIVHELFRIFTPETLHRMRGQCRRDEAVLEQIWDALIRENIPRSPEEEEQELLLRFHALGRPCPLLQANGDCLVYHLRPLTCRAFFSEDPDLCRPENAAREETHGTYHLPPGDEEEDLLEELHFAFGGDEITGLRALLGRSL
ncbi:MAG: hypothetical protein ACQEQV_10925 [Fibrobacterota bacterium]